MKMNVNFHIFQRAFYNMDRGDQFSYEGLRALFDYLEDREQGMEEEMELDVIALCCEYTEIDSDDYAYKQYIGENAEREDYIIARLSTGIIVCEG